MSKVNTMNTNIVLIYKGSKDLPSNYRPVSHMSVSFTSLAHVIFCKIMVHLDFYNYLMKFQHDFQKGQSCETQLVWTVEDVLRSLDQKKQQDVLMLGTHTYKISSHTLKILHMLRRSFCRVTKEEKGHCI